MRYLSVIFCLLSLPLKAQQTWYVDADASGPVTGTTWAGAIPDLQLALALSVPGDQIWIAEGTYRPTTSADRSQSFVVPTGVALYGGFAGTEQSLAERDPDLYASILDGDIGAPNVRTDNSFHVVTVWNGDTATILDGLTIRNGNADGIAVLDYSGGGILLIADQSGAVS